MGTAFCRNLGDKFFEIGSNNKQMSCGGGLMMYNNIR